MRILLCCLVGLLCTGCLKNASDWVHFRGDGGRGASRTRITPPLGIKWKINLQPKDAKTVDDRIGFFNPPVVMGDTVYFGAADKNFYALDLESGYMRWVFKSGGAINAIPVADQKQIYFASRDGKVYALSRQTGAEQWSFRTRSQVNSQVERYGDHVVFVSDADAVYFLSPEGEEQFSIDNPGWYNFTFLMHDDVMYFATGPRVSLLGPYDIKQKDFLWFLPYREIAAGWYSFPAVRKDMLYFGTADYHNGIIDFGFYGFNRHTGEIMWQQYREGIWNGYDIDDYATVELYMRNVELLDFMAPGVWNDVIIFTGGDTIARAFDAETGVVRWEQEFALPISSAPTLAGDRVYFGILGDDFTPPQLVCLSARNGKLLWQMETDGAVLSAPVIAGKRIVFGTDKSIFYVLEEVF